MEKYKHIPEPRKTKTLKPFLIIILGRSGVGKTTLAKTLTNCDDFVFYGPAEFPVDPNIPIEQMNKLLLRLGSHDARANIPKFESLVYENQDVFIEISRKKKFLTVSYLQFSWILRHEDPWK
jgi:AAA+ ATPase superfamily predicted ATPase